MAADFIELERDLFILKDVFREYRNILLWPRMSAKLTHRFFYYYFNII